MDRDDDIIRRAQLWATGATIHNVNNLIGCYRAAIMALDNPELTSKHAEAETTRMWIYKRLVDYMNHGDYRRASRENPTPDYLMTPADYRRLREENENQ